MPIPTMWDISASARATGPPAPMSGNSVPGIDKILSPLKIMEALNFDIELHVHSLAKCSY